MIPFLLLPVHDHAGLREGEGEEGPDRVQRNQPVCHPLEEVRITPGEAREGIDAVGKKQAPSS